MRHKNTTAGPDKDVRWLTDLLPQTFRDFEPSISARIFCFNYQSVWLGPQLSRNRLEGLAGRLLDDVHNGRGKVSHIHEGFFYAILTNRDCRMALCQIDHSSLLAIPSVDW